MEDGYKILPPTSNGLEYRTGLYVPKFTVSENPEFATVYGYIGESNRHKIASSFLKPVSWKEYCSVITSQAICSSGNDTAATRLPANEWEENSYYVHGSYYGYFHNTSDSDCESNESCFGHFVNLECDSSRFFSEAQMYWNDIALVSKGPGDFNGGYTSEHSIQIWYAAAYTRSNVMIVHASPSVYFHAFNNTDASFVRVQFPENTECAQHQASNTLKCSNNLLDRVGTNPLLFCDFPIERPKKIVSSMLKLKYDSVPQVQKSPALDFIHAFEVEIDSVQEIYNEIIRLVYSSYNNTYGDADRAAVCKWIYDNVDYIGNSLPKSHPRSLIKETCTSLSIASIFISFTAFSLTILASLIVVYFRKRSAIRTAHITTLAWVMGGKDSFLNLLY